MRNKLCNGLAQLFMVGFREKQIPPNLVKSGGRVTLWELLQVVLPENAGSWQNSCKMLNSDPTMGQDVNMKFRTFICILLKYDFGTSFL